MERACDEPAKHQNTKLKLSPLAVMAIKLKKRETFSFFFPSQPMLSHGEVGGLSLTCSEAEWAQLRGKTCL